jgi:hypothetical protein
MRVYAVGGKAFFHKDELKDLGFRWYREPKLWVKPDDGSISNLEIRLNAMGGITWSIQDLPVEDMFQRSRPANAENRESNVSSLERARSAAAKLASPPASNLAVFDPLAALPKEELDFTPELTRLRGRIAAMKLMLEEIEQEAIALAGRVEC